VFIDEIETRLWNDLTRAGRDGLAALADWMPDDALTSFHAFCRQLGEEHRPIYRLEPGSLVESPPGRIRLSIRRSYPATAFFVRDGQGSWRVGRSRGGARCSPDALVGVEDDIDTLPRLASVIGDLRAAKRLRVYLGGCDRHATLSAYAGFGASNDRLAAVRVVACRPDPERVTCGEIEVEGQDPPIPIELAGSPPRVSSLAGHAPNAFFSGWLHQPEGRL
jgi:hypothetical protein